MQIAALVYSTYYKVRTVNIVHHACAHPMRPILSVPPAHSKHYSGLVLYLLFSVYCTSIGDNSYKTKKPKTKQYVEYIKITFSEKLSS